MRIWILNHYAVPLDGAGGTRHATLARYLQQRGHEVTIFASATPHGQARAFDLPDGDLYVDRMYEGVRFRFVRTTPYRNTVQRFVNMLSYRQSVCRATADLPAPEVIIGSCVHLHAADAGLRLARCFGVPFVFEVRDVWPESLVDVGALSTRHPIYWYLRHIERNLYRHADRVIALFPGMVGYLEQHGIPREHIWQIPNGIDTTLYAAIDSPPPAANRFVVSFLGSHGPANGLGTVIEAAKLLQAHPQGAGIEVRLVGDGPQKVMLQQSAEAAGLQNVAFHPPVAKTELTRHFSQSHAFIFILRDMPVLARYGVSANKLFDYLYAGRPTIFACRSLNNPVEEAQSGISIPPEDPHALAQAILQLRDLTEAERVAMGERGRAWVIEHHDMRRLALKLENHLLELLGATEPSGMKDPVTIERVG